MPRVLFVVEKEVSKGDWEPDSVTPDLKTAFDIRDKMEGNYHTEWRVVLVEVRAVVKENP